MSKSNWGDKIGLGVAYLALLVIAFGASIGLTMNGYAELQKAYATYQATADSDREASANKIESTCFNTDRAKFSECLRGQIKSYYQQQATNQDLQAQQDMAFWAKALFFLGIGQAVASLIGIYLVWRTFNETRVSNEIAKNTATQELRPYLGVTDVAVNRKRWPLSLRVIDASLVGATTNNFLKISLKNFGQTPADEVAVIAYYGVANSAIRPPASIFEENIAQDVAKAEEIVRPHISLYRLSSGQEQVSDVAIFDPRPWQKASANQASLYVWGRIYYHSLSSDSWVLRFCYLWQPRSNRFIPYEGYNEERKGKHPFDRD